MTGKLKRLWNLARSSAVVVLALFLVKVGLEWYIGKQLDELLIPKGSGSTVEVRCVLPADAITTAYSRGLEDGRKKGDRGKRLAVEAEASSPLRPAEAIPSSWPKRFLACLSAGREDCAGMH